MKRIAFSVWPGAEGNIPRPDLEIVRNISINNIKHMFDEIIVVSDFAPFDKTSEMMFKKFKSPYIVKDFINWSDYIRVVKMINFLEGDWDEVFYFDYDLLIFEPPKTYGVLMEGHFESPDDKIETTYKFWMRGANGAYYLNKSHIPQLKEHLSLLQEYIESQNGKPKFCYPMNYLHPIEEKVGFIEGFYHLGSLDKPTFCTEEKCAAFVEIMVDYSKNNNWRNLNCMNMAGSGKASQEENIEACFELRKKIKEKHFFIDLDFVKHVVRQTTKPIRVNYGSSKLRKSVQEYFFKEETIDLFSF